MPHSDDEGRLRFLRRNTDRPRRRFRRGVYLLPSLFTLGNMFCGYACVVYAMRGEYQTAAPFIGFAIALDMLDGRIARLTGTESAFGLEFDSLADVISFGIAPAILSFAWGLSPLGRLGWAAGFVFVTAAAMRLARFNIQSGSGGDKRYFVGMPSPAAAAIPAATVYAYPVGLYDYREALPALAMVLVPALLMVSTIRFRSFKNKGKSCASLTRFVLGIPNLSKGSRASRAIRFSVYLIHGQPRLPSSGRGCHERKNESVKSRRL